jgi:V8-like Glu-specific endopeptidase
MTMYEITTRTTYPYSAICYITVTWPDGGLRSQGSGTVVGPNDILTALHVVFDSNRGGWATGITIIPGYDTAPANAPYGSFTNWGELDGRVPNWDTDGNRLLTNAEAQYDMAVIGMRSRIGDITGWVSTQPLAADFDGVMAGYPARKANTGGMMAEDVPAEASSTFGVYQVRSGLGAGASGGPLLHTSSEGVTSVVGSLSSGNSAHTSSTYAALYGEGTWDWLNAAMAANDDLIPGMLQSAFIGTAANDVMTGNTLDNTFSGGLGRDTVVFAGARSSYAISVGSTATTVRDLTPGRDGIDTLTGVERLRFTDGAVAFDLNGNAGVTAKILGAVFGKQAVANKAYAGIGLNLLDGGMLYLDVMTVALNAHLGAGATHEAVVTTLYTNVVGFAPTAEVLAHYTGLLQSGQYTHATLGMLAAETPDNAISINLTGLAAAGLDYTPAA